MFKIRSAGSKGVGVFASRRVARGARILAERPLLSINNTDNVDILAAARRLPRTEVQALLMLSVNEAKRSSLLSATAAILKSVRHWLSSDAGWNELSAASIRRDRDLLAVFFNNNFAVSESCSSEVSRECFTRAIFPTVARINHSCVPNAQGNFNTNLDGGSFTIHAVQDIATEEEITISYLHDELALRPQRQDLLRRDYDFMCECDICRTGQEAQESHKNRELLRSELSRLLGQGQSISDLAVSDIASMTIGSGETGNTREMIHLIIQTYERESLAGRELASLYAVAAGLATSTADHPKALNLSTRSLELEKDAVGEDSPFYEARQSDFRRMRSGEGLARIKKAPVTKGQEDDLALSYAPWT